eukprot:PhM_4_TR17063/c2_g1_i1/m.30817
MSALHEVMSGLRNDVRGSAGGGGSRRSSVGNVRPTNGSFTPPRSAAASRTGTPTKPAKDPYVFEVGEEVEALWGGKFWPAMVIAVTPRPTGNLYDVQYGDEMVRRNRRPDEIRHVGQEAAPPPSHNINVPPTAASRSVGGASSRASTPTKSKLGVSSISNISAPQTPPDTSIASHNMSTAGLAAMQMPSLSTGHRPPTPPRSAVLSEVQSLRERYNVAMHRIAQLEADNAMTQHLARELELATAKIADLEERGGRMNGAGADSHVEDRFDELKTANNALVVEISRIRQEKDILIQKLSESNDVVRELTQKLDDAHQQLLNNKSHSPERDEVYEIIKSKEQLVSTLSAERETLLSRIDKQQQTIRDQEQHIAIMNKDERDAEARYELRLNEAMTTSVQDEGLLEQIDTLKKELEATQSVCSAFETRLAESSLAHVRDSTTITDLRDTVKRLQVQLEDLNNKSAQQTLDNERSHDRLRTIENEVERLRSENHRLVLSNDTLEADYAKAKVDVGYSEQRVEALQGKLTEHKKLHQDYTDLRFAHVELEQTHAHMQDTLLEQVAEGRTTITQLQSNVDTLKLQLDASRKSHSSAIGEKEVIIESLERQ